MKQKTFQRLVSYSLTDDHDFVFKIAGGTYLLCWAKVIHKTPHLVNLHWFYTVISYKLTCLRKVTSPRLCPFSMLLKEEPSLTTDWLMMTFTEDLFPVMSLLWWVADVHSNTTKGSRIILTWELGNDTLVESKNKEQQNRFIFRWITNISFHIFVFSSLLVVI